MFEILHGWYGKLLSPVLVYYLGLPMLESFRPVLANHFCLTNIGWLNTNIQAYHLCLTNVGIYNTLPILVCHSLIPKINQIYANENHIISLHWNLKYFPVDDVILSPYCCAVTSLNIQQLSSRYLAVCQFRANTFLRKADGRVQI